jgi:DNA-binding GntR family transcriptional regulator
MISFPGKALFIHPLATAGRSLADQIADALQRDIVQGTLTAGQRLVERELTERFGVSSIPVREALRHLEGRGLVTKKHNCGCTVVELTDEDVRSISELRRLMETQVMRWAAERVEEGEVEALRIQVDRMTEAAAQGDRPLFFEEDLKLHTLLWRAARNPYAERALTTTMGSMFAAGLARQVEAAKYMEEEAVKHRRLVEAVASRDPDAAEGVLRQIMAGFEKLLSGSAESL